MRLLNSCLNRTFYLTIVLGDIFSCSNTFTHKHLLVHIYILTSLFIISIETKSTPPHLTKERTGSKFASQVFN